MDFFVWHPERVAFVAGAFLLLFVACAALERFNRRVRSWPLFAMAALWGIYVPWESLAQQKGWNIRVDLLMIHPALLFGSIAALVLAYRWRQLKPALRQPVDRNGKLVALGSLVRVVHLPDAWFAELPGDERAKLASMVGGVFPVDEIDQYGQPWVRKSWPNDDGTCSSHSIALEPSDMEYVGEGSNASAAGGPR